MFASFTLTTAKVALSFLKYTIWVNIVLLIKKVFGIQKIGHKSLSKKVIVHYPNNHTQQETHTDTYIMPRILV